MRTLNFHHVGRQMSESFLTAAVLSMSGGLQDVYTYVSRGEVFANAQTGNIVLLSQNVFARNWELTIRYLVPVLFLHLEWQLQRGFVSFFKRPQRLHWRQIILLIEIVLLFLVGFNAGRAKFLIANALVPFPVQCRFNPLEKSPAMHLPVQCVLAI